MDGSATHFLKALNDHSKKIVSDYRTPDDIPGLERTLDEEFNIEGGVTPKILQYSQLLDRLAATAQTSKLIRDLTRYINVHPSEQTKMDEDETVESIQETSEPNESTDINLPAEPLESTSSKPSKVDDTSTDSDKSPQSLQGCLRHSEIKPSEERKTFRVLMDVSHFLRKQLSVKVIGKNLVVHGEHEMLIDEHGNVSRKFTRQFEIPEDVDCETFRAFLDCYRVLTIEASFKPKSEKGRIFEVPIYSEIGSKPIFSAIQSLEDDFDKRVECHLREGQFMRDFARVLAKHSPSDYIPMEEVIQLLV